MSIVTVATLNLFHNMGRWDERFPLLLDQLTALRPDVIGLQNVAQRLRQATRLLAWVDTWQGAAATVVAGDENLFPSDHLGVVAKVNVG